MFKRTYQVFFEVHRNCRVYLGMVWERERNAKKAEEKCRRLFGTRDPYPFRIKAFRDENMSYELLCRWYGKSLVDSCWSWDAVTMKPHLHL